MPVAMSSHKMFRVGLILGIIGLVFNIVLSPLMNWAINQNGLALPIGMVGGLAYVLQQGSFYAGLFLLAGSFVVKSAEAAADSIRREPQAHSPGTAGQD